MMFIEISNSFFLKAFFHSSLSRDKKKKSFQYRKMLSYSVAFIIVISDFFNICNLVFIILFSLSV